MCGIVGQINYKEQVDREQFIRMRDAMVHRGPDGEGLYVNESGNVAIGHRRLTLIDLTEAGAQPMQDESGRYWLTYNGEVYNYQEIKVELEALGHRFKSHSDSEVILLGYKQWGKAILDRLKGMFAFGIWDEHEKSLFLARDRFGIKPLYYWKHQDRFVFASEIKGIITNNYGKPTVDFSRVCDYFVHRYVPSPYTIYEEINKLPPAHYLELDEYGNTKIERYWDIPIDNKKLPEDEVVAKIDELLMKSVDYHKISDVPVGVFLSGGYDSSAITYYLNRIGYPTKAFTIGFENWPESEHQYAKQVADKFDTPIESVILGEESLDLVEKLSYHYDEPIADISIVPTYAVSRMASQHVKAVLSGEGADELFCGYHWQKFYKNKSQEGFWKAAFPVANTILPKSLNIGTNVYADGMAMGKFGYSRLREVLSPELHGSIPYNTNWFYASKFRRDLKPMKAFQYMDVNAFMTELVLVKVDRASMANSLEVRPPFLDHELFEYLFQVDEDVYYKKDQTKFALRENIKDHMPPNILDREKQGFVGPDAYYMNINWYKDILTTGRLVKDGIINKGTLDSWIKQEDHWRLWKLIVLEFWYARWC